MPWRGLIAMCGCELRILAIVSQECLINAMWQKSDQKRKEIKGDRAPFAGLLLRHPEEANAICGTARRKAAYLCSCDL